MGTYSGSVGETFHLGIIIGGIFLMFTKVSDWRIPLSFISSVFVFAFAGTVIGGLFASGENVKTMGELISGGFNFGVFQVLAGSLLFGAMFMVTDPVTSPVSKVGKWIFGILCGLLTVLIRVFSGYVEGVMFSISL